MRILNIISQKPYSTGSGVYLSEIIREFEHLGHIQAIVVGINSEEPDFEKYKKTTNAKIYPAVFNTKELPFEIFGMSDTMPYPSRMFKTMSKDELKKYEASFLEIVKNAVSDFKPDLIICHHLYLLTAIVIENFPNENIVAISHGTCIRQLKNNIFERERIINSIKKLNTVFALQHIQKNDIHQIFQIPEENISIIGNGYNPHIFHLQKSIQPLKNTDSPLYKDFVIKLAYAGKISTSKGIKSLIKALGKLEYNIELNLAGGSGNEDEFAEIKALAKKSEHRINFLGPISQKELANLYAKCHLFVFPSFYEGLGLSIIEAMACGLDIVVSNTDGLQEWIHSKMKNPPIIFVNLPKMKNADEPFEEELPKYEIELADAIKTQIENLRQKDFIKNNLDITAFSWQKIAEKIIEKSF